MGIEIVFKDDIDRAIKKIGKEAEERMLEAVAIVRDATLDTLSGPRTGRTYFVPGTRKEYTASAPGEPPAVQLGDLRKSVKGGIVYEDGGDECKDKGDVLVGFVGTELPKGPMLEYGTTRMSARPWLRPSFERSMDKLKEIMTRSWF